MIVAFKEVRTYQIFNDEGERVGLLKTDAPPEAVQKIIDFGKFVNIAELESAIERTGLYWTY